MRELTARNETSASVSFGLMLRRERVKVCGKEEMRLKRKGMKIKLMKLV